LNPNFKVLLPIAAALTIAACNAGGSSNMPATGGTNQSGQSGAQMPAGRESQRWGANVRAACPDAGPGFAHCTALERVGPQIVPDGGSGPGGGFTPAQFEAAYNLPSSTKGSGQIVAIVDAYDNPDITTDLTVYRNFFKLPVANFTKYNQTGQTKNYPTGNTGWGVEEALDVDMVSASCPNCTIYLIEANSNSFSDLGAAEVEAVKLGAHIITNSYSGSGCSGTCGYGTDYGAPGVEYLASAGDSGYGIGAPAQFDTVVAVGGTSLTTDTNVKRGYNETVWNGTGGGCSTVTKPSWQHDPGCTYRTANDVAAAANPNAGGAAIYDTYGNGGWAVYGGTSESSPLNAGIFGLAGNASKQVGGKTFWTLKKKALKKDLWVISSGSDGSCGGSYLCTAGTKQYGTYSGPTGWGTPNGIGAY